jgi:hypothetical protein
VAILRRSSIEGLSVGCAAGPGAVFESAGVTASDRKGASSPRAWIANYAYFWWLGSFTRVSQKSLMLSTMDSKAAKCTGFLR